MLYLTNTLEEARIGFALSRRRIRGAVSRNRVRRIARESFRHARAALPACDIVLMASTAAADATPAEIRSSLERHWQRITRNLATSAGRHDG